MVDAIQSEWIKLSTLTVNKVLVAVAVAFPIVVTALVAAFTGSVFDSGDVADLIGGLAWLSALLLGVLATIAMSGEFNYNTIRPTFAAQPRRLRALLAKLVVLVAVTAVLVVAVLAASWMLGTTVLDGTFSLSDGGDDFFGDPSSTPIAALTGTVVLAVGVTVAGFGLGNLIRNTPAAVTALLLWPLVIENILARLLFAALDLEWGKYLPFTQGFSMVFTDRGGDPAELMSRVNAGLYFGLFVVAIAVLGLVRTNRSDA